VNYLVNTLGSPMGRKVEEVNPEKPKMESKMEPRGCIDCRQRDKWALCSVTHKFVGRKAKVCNKFLWRKQVKNG